MGLKAMAHPARFWDKIAAKYARTPIKDEAAYQRKLGMTRAYLTPEAQVYEFGCGTGSTALAHAPFAAEIVATDLSAAMVRIARDKADGVDNVSFGQGTLGDMAATGRKFDMVMGHSILHLLPDLDAALCDVRGMLAPGGVFVSSTACVKDILPAFGLIAAPGRWLGLLPYVSVFRKAELLAAFDRAGFEIVEEFQPGRKAAVFLVARPRG